MLTIGVVAPLGVLAPLFEKRCYITNAVLGTSDRRDRAATSPTEEHCMQSKEDIQALQQNGI
jgi:hypothetical protein